MASVEQEARKLKEKLFHVEKPFPAAIPVEIEESKEARPVAPEEIKGEASENTDKSKQPYCLQCDISFSNAN